MPVSTFPITAAGNDERLAEFSLLGGVGGWGAAAGGFNNRMIVGLGPSSESNFGGWMLFTGVTVPQGATINSAILELNNSGAGNGSTPGPVPIRIHCEDADNPTMPTSASDANNRALTSPVDLSVAYTTGVYNLNITAAVQAVVNRAGFAAGNAIGVFMRSRATSTNQYIITSQYEISAPKLVIDYTAGGPPLAVFAHHYRQQGFR